MGIRFSCPNGHRLHVKEFLAGKRGVCPACGAKFVIPLPAESQPAAPQAATAAAAPRTVERTSSPSVVIPVVPPSAAAPVERPANPAATSFATHAATVEPVPPSPVATPTATPVEPSVSVGPVSAAAKYAAHRERTRRRQTALAIVLGATVIVLAAVLVWILLGGPSAVRAAPDSEKQHAAKIVRGTSFGPLNRALTASTGVV